MNNKPLIICGAVLVLSGFSAFQWRDALLGRVIDVHAASFDSSSSNVATPTGSRVGLKKGVEIAQADVAPSTGGALTPAGQAAPASQARPLAPVSSQTAPPASAQQQGQVDESALRYFAARGDTTRLQAEIARLKALYPNWTPPSDPLAVPQTGDAQLETMWQLYSNGRYAEVRKAIADRQASEAGWQPPSNLTEMLDLAEARQRLVNSSDLKQYNAVIDVAAGNPGLLTCSEVDILWRVAEAFANTEKPERARDAYAYVLSNCTGSAERLATVQKASAVLPMTMMAELLSKDKPGPDGQLEFEPIKDDLARQFVAKAGEDKTVVVPQPYLMRLERVAESNNLAGDALLLGWYNSLRDNMDEAEKWFRRALKDEDSASAAQGLALALIARKEPREAEQVMYKWRNSSDDARAAYLAATANLLAVDPPVALEADVLQRIATETVGQKDAATAQEFGWYSRAFQQPQMAEQWFSTALGWKPDDEPSAYGLALTYQELNNQAQVRRLQQEWSGRSERIMSVGRPVAGTAQARTSGSMSVSSGQAFAAQREPSTTVDDRTTQEVAVARQPVAARQAPRTQRTSRCAISLSPERLSPQAALQQGWCLMDVNRPAEALKAFGVALKAGQSDLRSDAAYGQSLAYLRMGLTDNAAVSATKSAMDRNKATELQVAILTDRALAAYQNKRYEEALILLDQRARFATERIDLMVIRGYAYLNMRRFSDAIQIFEGAAATGNTDAIRGLSAAKESRPSRGPQGG